MRKLQFLIFTIIVLGFCTSTKGQVFVNYDSTIVIEGSKEWYSFPEIARLAVDVDEFPRAELVLRLPEKSSVFVNEVMWLFTLSDTSFTIPLQQIKEQFPAEASHRELVINKKNIQRGDISVKKGLFGDGNSSMYGQDAESIFENRIKSPIESFFLLAVLVVFFLISLFNVVYPDVLSFILHPVLVFSSDDFSDSNSITKFFTEEVLFFLVIFNMLLMGIIMVSAFYLEAPILEQLVTGGLNHMFLMGLLGTGILLVISLLKFVWLKICALIFGINKMEFVHFFYMLRVASVILIGIYFALIICFANDLWSVPILIHYLLVGFFIIYVLGILMLFFIMANKVTLKKYHLFSYLCTAELVPFLVLSKLIIG